MAMSGLYRKLSLLTEPYELSYVDTVDLSDSELDLLLDTMMRCKDCNLLILCDRYRKPFKRLTSAYEGSVGVAVKYEGDSELLEGFIRSFPYGSNFGVYVGVGSSDDDWRRWCGMLVDCDYHGLVSLNGGGCPRCIMEGQRERFILNISKRIRGFSFVLYPRLSREYLEFCGHRGVLFRNYSCQDSGLFLF